MYIYEKKRKYIKEKKRKKKKHLIGKTFKRKIYIRCKYMEILL